MKKSKQNIIKSIKTPDGTKIKFIIENDKKVLHSYEGPALEKPDGTKEYYIFGIQYSKEVWDEMRIVEDSENLDLE